MCFRRNEGKCAICFIPSITIATDAGNTVSTQVIGLIWKRTSFISNFEAKILKSKYCFFPQSSFGLSVSPSATIAYAGFETSCTADYLVISSAGTEATQTSKIFLTFYVKTFYKL